MKPAEERDTEEIEVTAALKGDAIGSTVYSERFALKILLKLANTDILKEEFKEKSFEDDLCTLWDMSAEKDVVLFLIKHEIVSLYCSAIPIVSESRRILEILIGIIGNMCCHKEGKDAFLQTDMLLSLTFQHLRCEDSRVLIQLLRLINSCLFLADEEELEVWLNILDNTEFANALYFMLRNSTNKDLLVTALENFNSLCSYCNVKKFRYMFFSQFVTKDALASVSAAFHELTVTQRDDCEKDETERILVISLQLAMNLVGFDKSPEMYINNRESVASMINQILVYYERKITDQKELDDDLVDIIESTNTVINMLEVGEVATPDQFFMPSYNIWKVLVTARREIENPPPIPSPEKEENPEIKNIEEVKTLAERLIPQLSFLMCIYMAHCSDENLGKALDAIGKDYDDVVKETNDDEIQLIIHNRAANYRSRLKDNVDA